MFSKKPICSAKLVCKILPNFEYFLLLLSPLVMDVACIFVIFNVKSKISWIRRISLKAMILNTYRDVSSLTLRL